MWGRDALRDPVRLARTFSQALAHRGPDGEGYLGISRDGDCLPCRTPANLSGRVFEGLFVHRRLSIIDLTTGDQPMSLADGRHWIVYNGEIYNYAELRRELSSLEPQPFRTSSDTEVILRVWRRWGANGLRRLNGMFAIALCDLERRELVLARDPVGVKPLYWTAGRHGVAFASEIGPLLLEGGAERVPSAEGIAQYLFYRFVPSPGTVWRDVRRVVPGHALRFDADGHCLEEIDFARPAPRPTAGADPGVLAEALQVAVRRQMVSDVPVGAFLSGGLDSSLIVAGMRSSVNHVATFGIGFAATPDAASELPLGARASSQLGTTHEVVEEEPASYFSRFAAAALQVEEPLAEPGILLLSDLAATAARRVKVVLTGQGADEPLGGYPRHQAARLARLLSVLFGHRWWNRVRLSNEQGARFLRVMAASTGPELAGAAFSPLRPEAVGSLVRGCGAQRGHDAILGGVSRWWRRGEGMDDLARMLYVDVRTSLADDLLLMGDKTAMAHGLEARVPFLDLEYLTLLEAIPGAVRIPLWRRRKWIQHRIAARLLPAPLARDLVGSRNPFQKKLAFEVPMSGWLRTGFGGRLAEVLAGRGSVLPDYVEPSYVRKVVDRYLRGGRQAYRTVFALYALELWLRGMVAQSPMDAMPRALAAQL